MSAGAGAAGSARAVKVKKEKVVVTAVKDAKADASFFSAPKPKPRLPSFKKAPLPPAGSSANGTGANGGAESNVAQPSNENPFQQALKEMSKGRASSGTGASSSATSAHSVSTSSGAVSSTGAASTSTNALESAKSVKKRKSVTWAADGQLEQVKLIEKAEYDDEPSEVRFPCLSSEGKAQKTDICYLLKGGAISAQYTRSRACRGCCNAYSLVRGVH